MSDFNSETRIRKPWTSRIQREPFEAFSSNCPGINGDKAARKRAGGRGKNRRERERQLLDSMYRTVSIYYGLQIS
eukprot:scaffold77626_cov59-Attheya_sp.AAC.1